MIRRVLSQWVVSRIRTEDDAETESLKAQSGRDLNEIVHLILVVGFVASAGLFIIGLVLNLIWLAPLPSSTVSPATALQLAVELQPGGFFSLGLIVLIATPMVRVLASAVVFLWQRDWRYTGITLLVLLIMVISIILGRG